MRAEQTNVPQRQSKRLEAALTIIVAQLLAVVLLFTGSSAALSLSVAAAVAILFLTRRMLWKAGRWLAAQVRRIVFALTARLLDRRTYRFGLRSLLLVILIVAILSAWFGYRYRAVSLEEHLLQGRWAMFNHDGKPFVSPDGTQYTFDFSEVTFSVDPFSEPKRLDYHTPQGVWRGIYRWDGDELLLTQASPGAERPVSFYQKKMILESTPPRGGPEIGVSVSTTRLRRIQ